MVSRNGVEGDEGRVRFRHALTPSVESDSPKGYRGGAPRSSKLGVPGVTLGAPLASPDPVGLSSIQ